MIVGWKVWYGNRPPFTSEDGPWEEAPGDGVQFVVVFFDAITEDNENLRLVHHGHDYFWKVGDHFGRTTPTTNGQLQVPEGLPPGALKKGRTVSDEKFAEIAKAVDHDRWWSKPEAPPTDMFESHLTKLWYKPDPRARVARG